MKALIYVNQDDGTVREVFLVGTNVTPVEFLVVGDLPVSAPNTTTPSELMERFFHNAREPRN